VTIFEPDDLTQRFAPLARASGVVLAVSGGPDSIALMLLVHAWRQQTQTEVPVTVATVDHALRPEARQEAEAVAVAARVLGFPHEILEWQGAKPATRIQERAREARYALLFRHARDIGADHIVTAHHADDQAETILFRLLRGSALAGLAGMPKVSHRDGLIHLRPLLDCPKAALVAHCEAQQHAYIRDPSNENPAFARARLRRLAPLLAQEGLDRHALLRLGRRAARADLALTASVERLRAALPALRGNGSFQAPIAALTAEPPEILARLVEIEIQALRRDFAMAEPGPFDKPLRLERLETLADALQGALTAGRSWRGSLAGMAISLDGRANLTICAEKPRRRGRLAPQATQNSPLREVLRPADADSVTSE
jgi:tRNA(Ile)-lysidine synthase